MTKRGLTDEERRVWRKVARTVTPLARQTSAEQGDEADRPDARGRPVGGLRTSAVLVRRDDPPKSPPADFGGDKRIRRGRAPVEARLDLHGHTQETARSTLAEFLSRQRREGARCVLVITGKGRLGSGVLKARFLDWLAEPDLRSHVSGYAAAHQRHGGGGAYYVFLKRAAGPAG